MNDKKLRRKLQSQVHRIQQSEKEQPTLLVQTSYIGTLGLLLILPIIGGAYLGHWLDGLATGYSVRWTGSLIVLGVFIGGINIYWLIKQRE